MSGGRKQRYYTDRLLYVSLGNVTRVQLSDWLKAFMETCDREYGLQLSCPFKINIPFSSRTGRDGETQPHGYGYGYIFVENAGIAHILLGHNPDGTPRMEEVEDPTWIPATDEDFYQLGLTIDQTEIQLSNTTNWAEISDFSDTLNELNCRRKNVTEKWSPRLKEKYSKLLSSMSQLQMSINRVAPDPITGKLRAIAAPNISKIPKTQNNKGDGDCKGDGKSGDGEGDAAAHLEEEKARLECVRRELAKLLASNQPRPLVKRQLPPLVELPPYERTVQQYEEIKSRSDEPDKIAMLGHFQFEPGYANGPRSNQHPHILTCNRIPHWVGPDLLYKAFRPFVDHPQKEISVWFRNREFKGKAPQIFIDSKVDFQQGQQPQPGKGGRRQEFRTAYIMFGADSSDACIALLMSMKLPIKGPERQECSYSDAANRQKAEAGKGRESYGTDVTLYFTHAPK